MKKLKKLFLFILSFSMMQFAYAQTNTSDSLADIFPLAIGNKWIYSFSTTYWAEGWPDNTYSGTDTIQIIDKKIVTDTIKWLMKSRIYADTIELNELQQGRHQLFINQNIDFIGNTIFPFYPHVDTMVFRYDRVDSSGIRTFYSWNMDGRGFFHYTFKWEVGLLSVTFNDGCTCMDGFYGNRTLLGQNLTSVNYGQVHLWNYQLNQNYPNPFNPSTIISFNLPTRTFVTLKIFDLLGREVATLISEELSAGNYSRQWNASKLPSGIYFYRLQAGSYAQSKKLVLLK
jgi:hypothetical protein